MDEKKIEEQLPEEEVTPTSEECEDVEVEVIDAQEACSGENEPENELTALKEAAAIQEDKFLRLAAEYDNYRKRTAKEKEALWADAKISTMAEILPVYDNLERAIKQETTDTAFKKGVEMTMTQLKEVLEKLGVSEIAALGEPFNPEMHNAVMHVEDENFGESTVCEVFQTGFALGEKVIRFAVVKVAN